MLIPFAGPAGASAPGPLALPNLEKLLARLAPAGADEGERTTLSPPHERVLARARGLPVADGLLPLAAWQARDARAACAWLTPCHWRVGTDHIAMAHPGELQLAEDESRALLAAMQPYFEEDGLQVTFDAPTRWLARGEAFRDLPTASLDRAIGRLVDDWLPRGAGARPIRRLQQEMQMLLYTHPLNDARVARGLPPVNSFWVSGTGALPADPAPATPARLRVDETLRDAALQGDVDAWSAAWQRLDGGELAALWQSVQRGEPVQLTLAGERSARSWSNASRGLGRRITQWFSRPRAAAVLQTL